MRLIAQIAVDEGLASSRSVADADTWARREGVPLVGVLVERLGLDEERLCDALARRLGLRRAASLDGAEPEALREVPHILAKRVRALPLSLEVSLEGPRVIRVAMADPSDTQALAELETQSGCRIEPLCAPFSQVDAALEQAYRGFVTQVMPERPRPFGADLEVVTPMRGRTTTMPPGPSTQPFHRLEDEAPLELRLRALIELLERKGLLTEEEWLAEVKRLLRDRE